MKRVLPLLTVAVALSLTTAGCTHAPRAAGHTTASAHSQAVRFAECMRRNGVQQFPDPDASGALTIDEVANGSSVNTKTPTFARALHACKTLEPAGFTGFHRTPAQQAAALKFARCIRGNGVPDFPDPSADQALIDTTRIPSTDTTNGMSALNAAMRKCRSLSTAAGATGAG